jgi:DNA-binding beta-propeller fold protein YncE
VLFVTDTGYHRVLKYDGQGTLLASWGEEGGGPGQVVAPAGIATTPNRVFVADAGNRRIQWFDFDGALLGAFATRFENDGWPSGLALDDRGRVLVTDTTNHSVHVFTDTGVEVARWGGPGIVEGRFNNPYDIAVAPGGAVYVTEHDNHRVQLFRFEPLGVQPAAWSRVKTLFR